MKKTLEKEANKEQQCEINELISTILLLPKEDRAILLSNAQVLRARQVIAENMTGVGSQKSG